LSPKRLEAKLSALQQHAAAILMTHTVSDDKHLCGSYDAPVGRGGKGPSGFKIQNSRFKIQDEQPGVEIQDSKFKIQQKQRR
jgi:hypothetical protein